MSLKGRIKRPEPNLQHMSLTRIGKIKTGYKHPEKGYPVSTDYFMADGKYAAMFIEAYGQKPQSIQIVFISDDPAEVCNEYWEYRDKKGKTFARGDGWRYEVWDGKRFAERYTEQSEDPDIKINEKLIVPDIREKVEELCPSEKGWQVTLKMKFLIPAVRGVMGYFEYNTKGAASTIIQITNVFDTMLENRGFVKGIIFDLNVEFVTNDNPGEKKKFPVVTLVPNMSERNIKMVNEAFIQTNNTQNLLLLGDNDEPKAD